ncbi:uncharacterized protein LOC136026835 isoform X1 [Artemia franciscana]|uniref:uncharacterized protein LOC136026835 isoform X1 n=1 Tax=Artemia franciscana TaxID=6661 RepID=UPI0032DBD681
MKNILYILLIFVVAFASAFPAKERMRRQVIVGRQHIGLPNIGLPNFSRLTTNFGFPSFGGLGNINLPSGNIRPSFGGLKLG